MWNIYFTGDTHGLHDFSKIEYWITKVDKKKILIQLGDWGALWEDNLEDNKEVLDKWVYKMNKNNFELFVVPGNHENYNLIFKLPLVDIDLENVKGKARLLEWDGRKIYILTEPELYIDNKRFLVVRGATSVDKLYRVENISWWVQETLSYKEEKKILEVIEKNNKFDYVVSHTCPYFLIDLLDDLRKKKCSVSKFLDEVCKKIEFKEWYFGHFHIDRQIRNFICLYDLVIGELDEEF
jgi:DNA repair exonuclease SbcCD nuclease subunit